MPILRALALFVAALAFACGTPKATTARPMAVRLPSAEEVAAAEIGPSPNLDEVKLLAERMTSMILKDPMSAIYRWPTSLTRSYYRAATDQGDHIGFGWELRYGVNAKNSYGGYNGERVYTIHFRDGAMVATGEPGASVISSESIPPKPIATLLLGIVGQDGSQTFTGATIPK